MAIIKVGAPLSGIRGTLGGITYSENASGTYAKQWARACNPRTSWQMAERGYLARMPSLWAALTDVQRADWRSFAADPAQEKTNPLGEPYYASGYNWFCQCNISLLRVGRATIQNFPTQARPAAPTIDDFRVCVAGTDIDITTGGVASSSSYYSGMGPAKAFDGDLNTIWSTDTGVTAAWIEYYFALAVNIKRYRIRSRTTEPTLTPRDWQFQVYTSGAWVTLQTISGVTMAVSTWYEFFCENPYTERQYRLNITANNGGPDYLQIAEIEMMTAEKGESVVVYPEDDFEDTPDYDLVLQVSMGNSIGMSVQYPGFYEILAKQSPGRWYETFQTEIEATFGTVLMERSWYAKLFRQTQEGYRSAEQTARTVTIGG